MTNNPDFRCVASKGVRVISGRLLPGVNVFQGIKDVCRQYNVQCAYISCGVVSLKEASFFYPVIAQMGEYLFEENSFPDTGETVLFSGERGFVVRKKDGEYHVFLRGSFSVGEKMVWDGHMQPEGNIALTEMDIVITEVDKY